jgi:hypothetical protein
MKQSSSLRAPCFAEAVAQAYSDPHCGSSIIPSTRSISSKADTKLRPRTKTRHIISSLLLLLLAVPIASALFDPGVAETREQVIAPQRITSSPISSNADTALSLFASQSNPVSLHPGCRRTSDLFETVCRNPWSPFTLTQGRKSISTRSELIICPLEGASNAGERERVFAITGTITLPESALDGIPPLSSSMESFNLKPALIGGEKEAYWPKPGDEGFWRQRDGKAEWVPTEPRALLESDVSPALPSSSQEAGKDAASPDQVPLDAVHAKEYDAWSASIGGEESETWTSFESWRERHLAAEREQEKQHKNGLNRKNKADKVAKKGAAGQAANATERVADTQTQNTSQEPLPTAERSVNSTTANSNVETPKYD